jgi:hypothetical protein
MAVCPKENRFISVPQVNTLTHGPVDNIGVCPSQSLLWQQQYRENYFFNEVLIRYTVDTKLFQLTK